MIKDSNKKEVFSLTEKEHQLLSRCKQKIKKEDSQVLGIVCGDVGCGKSIKAQHWGFFIDPTIDIARICFNKDEFIESVVKNKKKVIIADEGISLFFSRNSMTKDGRLIAEIMDQIRQKNLCVLICVPKATSIDWNILDAANFIAYVWEGSKVKNGKYVTTKGNVALYPKLPGLDYKAKIINYFKKKKQNVKYNPRPAPWCTIPGNPIGKEFKTPFYPTGEKAYRKKKESILEKYMNPIDGKTKSLNTRKEKKVLHIGMIQFLKQNDPSLTDGKIAKLLNLSRVTVNTHKNGL